jgi:formate dehydrogenase accessory protein FdhD
VVAYDVSRYSSLAKALGYAIKSKYNMGESVVVTSGRASGDLIVMTANTGIPVVATTKSPIYSGYVAAITYKVTLITISRRSGEVKLRVLAYPERVVTPSPHPWEA